MARIIDLSRTIVTNNPVFPGDPEVAFYTHTKHEETGYCVCKFKMGTHTGTHIDVPLHRIPGGMALDETPLKKTMGTAFVADLTGLAPGQEITAAHLAQYENEIAGCTVIILKTGWSSHYGQDDFFSGFNGITEEAAKWVIDKKLDMIALESPSVHPQEHLKIHQIFLEHNILVAESLCNVESIQQTKVEFFAVPLKLKGLDGSPVRAFAIEK